MDFEEANFVINDGQHRCAAIAQAIKENPALGTGKACDKGVPETEARAPSDRGRGKVHCQQGKTLPDIPNFVHSSNSGFASSAQTKALKNGWFIEIGDDQDRLIEKGREILNACGLRNVGFRVLLDDGTARMAKREFLSPFQG
jgi:hypothetical protein